MLGVRARALQHAHHPVARREAPSPAASATRKLVAEDRKQGERHGLAEIPVSKLPALRVGARSPHGDHHLARSGRQDGRLVEPEDLGSAVTMDAESPVLPEGDSSRHHVR
jgi:hypothetical protein